MEIDGRFLANAIYQVGSMASATILDQYRQKEAEKRLLSQTEQMMKIREPYDIRHQERAIKAAKEQMLFGIKLQQDHTEWQTKYTNDMTTYFNSEALQKKVQGYMTKQTDEAGNKWVRDWQRVSGKVRRYENLDEQDESFIESLDSVSRMNINHMRRQKELVDRNFFLNKKKAEERILYLQSTILSKDDALKIRKLDMYNDIQRLAEAVDLNKKGLADEIAPLRTGALRGLGFGKKGIWEKGKIDPKLRKKLIEIDGSFASKFAVVDNGEARLKEMRENFERLFGEDIQVHGEQPAVASRRIESPKMGERSVSTTGAPGMEKYEKGKLYQFPDPKGGGDTILNLIYKGKNKNGEHIFVPAK